MNKNPAHIGESLKQLHGKTIFVTGAGGFIGGALHRRLAEAGLTVTGSVLNEAQAREVRQQGLEAVILDLASESAFEPYLEDVDVVFNIAAMFQETDKGEALYDLVNNHAALKLCQAAQACGVERFVHCSTVGVHGDVQEIPCKETSPYHPMDLYHRTKLAGEIAILDFAKSLGPDSMVVTVNRPAMVYGPTDTRMYKLFKQILNKRFLMIGSGEVLAHLGYIDDQVDSLILSATAPRKAVHLEAFNIASDAPVTLNELAQTIADSGSVSLPKFRIPVAPVWLAGLLCEILWAPFGARPPLFRRRVGFFTHNRAFDLSKAETRMGYRSQWPHKRGIEETIRWYREKGMV